MKQILISDIKIGKRLRKDIGNLDGLVSSIDNLDLLHPIVIDEYNNLIAGLRRIEACKKLHWEKIPVNIISLHEKIFGEIEENQSRKDFTESEKAEIQILLKEKFSKQTNQGQRNDLTSIRNQIEVPQSTLEKIGKIFDESPDTVHKRISVIQDGDNDIIDNLDAKKISVNSAYNKVKNRQRKLGSKTPNMPENQYNVWYVDPPWEFDNQNTGGSLISGASQKYPTMSTDDIITLMQKMPFHKNSVLFMWATNAMLPDAMRIISELGFTYKGKVTWRKTKFLGLGYWYRNVTEDCLFAIKGDVKAFHSQLPNFFEAPNTKHSEKPDQMRTIIEDGIKGIHPIKKIELFARKETTSWKAWGNQIA